MAAQIPNLWSEDVRVDILSPLAILRTQASLMGELTKGILEAEIESNVDHEHAYQIHSLFLVAPALEHYRHLILRARHRLDLVYPVMVFAECFNTDGSGTTMKKRGYEGSDRYERADSDEEFMDCLRMVF